MVLAVILFAGFVSIALAAVLAALAFIDVAFNVWESAERADRHARYTETAAPAHVGVAAVEPALPTELSPRVPQIRAHQWAQSA
jgi:hypothetical protein